MDELEYKKIRYCHTCNKEVGEFFDAHRVQGHKVEIYLGPPVKKVDPPPTEDSEEVPF